MTSYDHVYWTLDCWLTVAETASCSALRRYDAGKQEIPTMDDITGKVALVTGASRGIGRAVALALGRAGCAVAVNYRSQEAGAHAACAEIQALGCRCLAVQADVSQSPDVRRLVGTVERDLGPLDILVNNAGVTRPQRVEDITEQDWDDIIDINLKSASACRRPSCLACAPACWGRIINVSSVVAQLGGIVGPHYAASKAGLHGLTHGYATFLAKEGITANVIAPALIATEMLAANPRVRPDTIPVGRFGAVDEVADVAVMLARNGYITGQTINVNGGWYMS